MIGTKKNNIYEIIKNGVRKEHSNSKSIITIKLHENYCCSPEVDMLSVIDFFRNS